MDTFKSRLIQLTLASALTTVTLSSASAEEDVEQTVIDPVIGQPTIEMHSKDFEVTGFAGLAGLDQVTTNGMFGVRFAYHLTENIFAEGSYSVTGHSNSVTYYDGVIGYQFPGQLFVSQNYRYNTATFLVFGGGKTDFENTGGAYNTIVGGGGYRVMITDDFNVRFDLRGHVHHQIEGDRDGWSIDFEAAVGLGYYF
ncbi:outer membrane beta-barrel domain-containing protein [Thalassotalea mangrovi]|uniref:Outer membrane beta-barrel domain-containing protein n=1 Tax=Thalassotalea mangrovi TaxID=2572245 RepID=A0A4V5NWX2_9GAMM|nr:outer membrane beta-barrel domain-containing protein [Thalassotalea mangrovi]TKB46096.1 outer membrane beta-barrel domain-containing protein [Thalassotalea mangrovi]